MRFLAILTFLLLGCITGSNAQNHAVKVRNYAVRDSVTIRHIVFEGNNKTKESVLLRELSVTEGDKIKSAAIDEQAEMNRKRLMNIMLFSESYVVTEVVDDSTIDWHFKVREQSFIIPEFTVRLADRNMNVWWTEQHRDLRRINLGVYLKHRNLRGRMEQLNANVQVGYTQKLGLEYFRPYIDKKQQHGIGASFFFAKNEEVYYNSRFNKLQFVKTRGSYLKHQFEAAFLYVHRPGYANKHSLELRYKDFRVGDTVVKLNKEYYENASNRLRLMEFTYRYDLNKVDNWNYPLTGLKVVGYAIVRTGIVGMSFQSQLMAEAGYFKKLSRKLYFAEVFRGRLSAPEQQPYVYKYAMGSGSEYVRGYEYYVIDGAQYGVLRTDLKFELLYHTFRNIPISFLAVIPVRLYPKVYVDIGGVSNQFPGTSFLNNKGLLGYGVGIDFISAYDFKFRLEYSLNHLGQKGLFLHLNSE